MARTGAPAVGDVAPDFDLPAHGGGRIRLSDLRGRLVVLYVMREFT